jgi:aldehyde dehydrogenase
MQYTSENIVPVTLELSSKSPNIFTESVFDRDDEFLEKTLEGFAMFALNQGEVCTYPSRALIQESIYDEFMSRALERVKKIKLGDPLDPETMMGAQASSDQFEKILSYIELRHTEGAKCLTGGKPYKNEKYPDGLYTETTVFTGQNRMRGNLRTGRLCHHVPGRKRTPGDCQRHSLRARCRSLDTRHAPGIPDCPRD